MANDGAFEKRFLSNNNAFSHNSLIAINSPLVNVNFSIIKKISKTKNKELKERLFLFNQEMMKVFCSYHNVVYYITINHDRIRTILTSFDDKINVDLLTIVFPLPNLTYISNEDFFTNSKSCNLYAKEYH